MNKIFLILLTLFTVLNCDLKQDTEYDFMIVQVYIFGSAEIKLFKSDFNGVQDQKMLYGTNDCSFYLRYNNQSGILSGSLENQGHDGNMRLYIYHNGNQLFYQESVGGGSVINFNVVIN